MESFGSREIFRSTCLPPEVVLSASSVRSSDRKLPFHLKKFPFSAENLSKFGSRRNRKLPSGCQLCFNRIMSFHFLLVSGQPGRARARVRRDREWRSREERGLVVLRKKDDRSRFRPWLTGRFGKILQMEGTPGVWYVSCSSNFTLSY